MNSGFTERDDELSSHTEDTSNRELFDAFCDLTDNAARKADEY